MVDVAKARSLGVRAAMIGRATQWGLAANGQAGVENELDMLRSGKDSAVLGLDHRRVADLSPHGILVPAKFDGGTPSFSAARLETPAVGP